MRVSIVVFVLFLSAAVVGASGDKPPSAIPTFYRDVLPILQKHCQQCHRSGEIAPMPLVTYDDVKRWTRQIANDTRSKRMPPWFADPCCGHFADDPSLTELEIATLAAWAATKAPGDARDSPPPPHWTEGWNIPTPDIVFSMVVLVPQSLQGNADLFRRDQSDSDGTFSLYQVIPGRYTVVAIENGWNLDWQNPDVLRPYLEHGQSVEVPGSGTYKISVPAQASNGVPAADTQAQN